MNTTREQKTPNVYQEEAGNTGEPSRNLGLKPHFKSYPHPKIRGYKPNAYQGEGESMRPDFSVSVEKGKGSKWM